MAIFTRSEYPVLGKRCVALREKGYKQTQIAHCSYTLAVAFGYWAARKHG